MKRDMKVWKEKVIAQNKKKAMPVLSFPGARIIGATVEELVKDGHLQAKCMKSIAKKYDMGMALSLMDLSVEAEAFGSPVHYSEDEVPTVLDVIVHTEEEAENLKIPNVGDGRTGECVKGIKEAGANGVVMAEPAAGLLSPNLIEEFSTPYVNKIREAVEDDHFMVMYHKRV